MAEQSAAPEFSAEAQNNLNKFMEKARQRQQDNIRPLAHSQMRVVALPRTPECHMSDAQKRRVLRICEEMAWFDLTDRERDYKDEMKAWEWWVHGKVREQ